MASWYGDGGYLGRFKMNHDVRIVIIMNNGHHIPLSVPHQNVNGVLFCVVKWRHITFLSFLWVI